MTTAVPAPPSASRRIRCARSRRRTLNEVVADGVTDGPIHIHVAEQVKEVEDCVAWSGQRPVAWLLDHMPVDSRWCADPCDAYDG
jgi:cytosine/adenosine deaminase-related metal-dependent hydrolase